MLQPSGAQCVSIQHAEESRTYGFGVGGGGECPLGRSKSSFLWKMTLRATTLS
jgi:hypothetical protein